MNMNYGSRSFNKGRGVKMRECVVVNLTRQILQDLKRWVDDGNGDELLKTTGVDLIHTCAL
jgi:hypothetical protein